MKFFVEPWTHQLNAIMKANHMRDLALFWEMGTGKTATTINILRGIFTKKERIARTLIFGPSVVLTNWKDEFCVHSKVSPTRILVLDGPIKKRIKRIENECFTNEGRVRKPNILITNYEAAQDKDFMAILHKWLPEVIVCDELHRIKSHKSKRAKAICKLADKSEHNYGLTGTPILNSPMDIFMQYRFLDRGKTFGFKFLQFRSTYFEDANSEWVDKPNHFPKFIPKPHTEKKLNALIYKKALRARKDECLDLPPLVKKQITVELSPKQRKAYEQMKRDFIAWVETTKGMDSSLRATVAQSALTKVLRMQQITSGFIKDDEGKEHLFDKIPKLDALKELLEDLAPTNKVIVWSCFKQNYKMIERVCNDLKLQSVQVHGGITQKQKQEAVEAFRKDSNIRVFIGNQAAGGIGINLTEATYSIFYSRSFSLEQDLQAEARNYRGGSEQHEKITRINLVARESVDQLIAKSLAGKMDISEKILDYVGEL